MKQSTSEKKRHNRTHGRLRAKITRKLTERWIKGAIGDIRQIAPWLFGPPN